MSAELTTALIGLILAVTGLVKLWTDFLKLKKDRAETKEARDKDSQVLHDLVLKHDFAITTIKDNQALHNTVIDDLKDSVAVLNTNVVKLGVVVDNLTDIVKELKNEKA